MSESALWLLAGKELGETVLDESMPKENGEILMRANAYAPHGKPHGVVRAAVELDGRPLKEVAVVGDRVWKNGAPTEPEPFVVKRLRWEDAFGGSGFKPNPVGKGYQPTEGSPLPNIEDRRRLITSMRQTPEPTGVGPCDITWPQRMEKAGTYDKAWFDKYYPGLARDIDWGFFNVAPRDQQIRGFFRGDEELVFRNLHPERPNLACRLPAVQLRCFMRRKRRSGEEVDSEIEMKLDTLWLFPHAAHGILVFHGTARVREDDASDVSVLYLGCEDLGEPKPLEHYRKVLEQRLGKEHGAIAALDDRPLMPRLRGDMKRPPSPTDEMAGIVATEHLAYKNMMKKGERHVMETRALLVAEGLDPDEHGPRPFDDVEMTGSLEEMLARAQDQPAPELRSHEHNVRLRAELLKAHARGESLAGRDLTGANLAGIQLPGANLEDALMERCNLTSANLAGANLKRAVLVRAVLCDARLDGANLEGANLSKADCSRAWFADGQLRDAMLLETRLSSATLDRVSLERALLNDAKLDGCSLRGIKAEGMMLDGLDLERTSFAGAELADAVFMKCALDEVDFTEANLAGATLFGCRATRAIFAKIIGKSLRIVEGTTLDACDFREADLEIACLRGTRLVKCDFTSARAPLADFSECDLTDACLYHLYARQARFVRADLTRANLVGADLFEASLAKAVLAGTQLNGANLYQSDMALVRGDADTRMRDTINARARFKPYYSDKVQDLD